MLVKKKRIVDQIGIITSGLCTIHCAAIPVLLSLGMMGSVSVGFHDNMELVVIGLSSFLGIWSIYNGLSGHGRLIPQVLIASGAFLIILGISILDANHGFMALGGLALVSGHWMNWRQLSLTD